VTGRGSRPAERIAPGQTVRPVRRVVAAPFWRRAIAVLGDLLLPGGLLVLIGLGGVLPVDVLPPPLLPWADHLADLLLHRAALLGRWVTLASGVTTAYLFVFYGLLGRTPGDWLTGLRLVNAAGEPAGPLRSLLRVVLLLPTLLPCGAGFWWAAADGERRALYDRLSGTYLILDGRRGAERNS